MANPSRRPPPPAPAPNTPFGSFTLLERIGVGGMAEVFRALEPAPVGDPRLVVVKRMLPHVAAEAFGEVMFEEEARLASRVRHPNVVEMLGAGRVGDTPYLVLEYVRGCDLWRLTRWLQKQGRAVGIPLSVFVARRVLAALQAVHDAKDDNDQPLGIVHQDVSPSNVLLSIYGDVKLGDFGIARARLREQAPHATLGAKGKLGYLAPEQVTGGHTDARSDVFSAGVVAAELLMGRPLFQGGSELAVLLAIRDASIKPFLQLKLPDDLKGALAAALSKLPDERPASAAELGALLEPFQGSDDEPLHKELAGLVQAAAGFEAEEQKTPQVTVPPTMAETPMRSDYDSSPPATMDLPSHAYTVFRSDHSVEGPLTFAELVERITTGRVAPHDKVSIDGAPARPVQDHMALMRHLPMSTLTPITQDTRAASEPDIRRNIAGGGFVRAIAETAVSKDTGLWLCEQGGVRKEIYVNDGVPEFVSSNLAGEMLGEFLVSRGVIDRSELDMALAVLPRYDGKLGDTLVALGLLEPVQLFQHLAAQVREKILDLFLWEAGSCDFYRGIAAPTSGFPLGLDVWALLDEGLRRRLENGMEGARFQSRITDSLKRVPQLPAAIQEGSLPEHLEELLALSGQPVPLTDLVDLLEDPTDETRGYRAILLGLQLQLIQWEGPEVEGPG